MSSRKQVAEGEMRGRPVCRQGPHPLQKRPHGGFVLRVGARRRNGYFVERQTKPFRLQLQDPARRGVDGDAIKGGGDGGEDAAHVVVLGLLQQRVQRPGGVFAGRPGNHDGDRGGHCVPSDWPRHLGDQVQQVGDLVVGDGDDLVVPGGLDVAAEGVRRDVADGVLGERLVAFRAVDQDDHVRAGDAVGFGVPWPDGNRARCGCGRRRRGRGRCVA